MSPLRIRLLKRAGRGLVAVVLGAAATAVVSPAFRDFVGDGPAGVVVAAIVPPLVLALEKWWRDHRTSA